jgi:hypothetical protein
MGGVLLYVIEIACALAGLFFLGWQFRKLKK